MVKVSIIMPSLNVADYIELAVKSVMEQTIEEIEIICIDAGSEDGTWEKLECLSKEDKRITLVRTNVRSYGYQVNLGIKMASGEYVAIVETDDFVDSRMYEVLYRIAKTSNCDYVKADYKAFWTQGNKEKVYIKRKNLTNAKLYNKVICPKDYPIIGEEDWYLWTGIYNRKFLISNNIMFTESKGAAFQDIGFLIKTMQYAKCVMYIEDMMYNYCIDREGASSNQKKSLSFAYAEFNNNIENARPEKGDNELFYVRMAKSFTCCASEMAKCVSGSDEEYFNWFVNQLRIAIEKGYIYKGLIANSNWEKTEYLVYDRDKFFEEKDKNINLILGAIQNEEVNEVVIFGCGNHGYYAYKWVKNNSINLVGFMDNNNSLWNTQIDGVQVYSPQNTSCFTEKTAFIVANEKYYDEIRKQLLEAGVLEKNIIIF